jgi:poly-gamma-glutamate synthesis protein (capsule biosynthesis protein)
MISGVVAFFTALIISLVPFVADAPGVVVEFLGREEERATILFAGDMMFDRTIRIAMREEGDDHVFSCLPASLWNQDLIVANLEGPITTNRSTSEGSAPGSAENFSFTFSTSTATLLARHNIRLVNLGNNHILNFGNDGAAETLVWLKAAGVDYFGDPLAPSEDSRVARREVGGIPFSFVSWSDWTGGKEEDVLRQISAERAMGRMVVVYTHWGDEYVPPNARVRALAKRFVDAGAEIVIGSHPHVVLEKETYQGKEIYYSLGNFVFDQYFTEEVRTGLLVRVIFDSEGVLSIEEIPTYLERDRRTCLK